MGASCRPEARAPRPSRVGRPRVGRQRVAQAVAAAAATPVLVFTAAAPASAHGAAPGPPELATLWQGWSFDAEVWIPVVLAAWAYTAAVRSVDRAHPANPVPRYRHWAWYAGLLTIVVALQSPIERYDTTLFSVHMIQHLLLTLLAPPLLLIGAPVTLALRAASPETRKRILLPVLHSRAMRVISHPVAAWVLFAAVGYLAHFSALFDAALEDPFWHFVEHALFLSTALLFWWPVVGADPGPGRLRPPARVGYVALGMPWSSFLGLAIFSASSVLYPHYASVERDWGPTPLEDQALAGGLMWAIGDLVFISAIVLAIRTWLRAEEAEGRRIDAQLDREQASERGRAPAAGGAESSPR